MDHDFRAHLGPLLAHADAHDEQIGGERWVVFGDELANDPDGFALEVASGLAQQPRRLEPRFLYDARGSELFTEITRQPEYYPTRAEAEILERHAAEIHDLLGNVPLCELGSGTSEKTRHLLTAWTSSDVPVEYIPIDIDPSVLEESADALTREFGRLHVTGVAASYEDGLDRIREVTPKVVAFLGSSVGNFRPPEYDAFFAAMTQSLRPGDWLLLGVDLVKDPAVLEAAYDDAAGVTAAFTQNLFARMNRELGTKIPLESVRHVAEWNPAREQIEIFGEFGEAVNVVLESIGERFRIERGERIWTEVCRKFRVEPFSGELRRRGFSTERVFHDAAERFALILASRTAGDADLTAAESAD